MPTAIWKSRLRSGSAHCDLEVAVKVRQCPLESGARGGGPAVPTGIWSSQWRSGCAHWDLDCEEEAAGEEAEEENYGCLACHAKRSDYYGLNDWMPQIPEGTGHRSQRDMINSCFHAQWP